MTEHDGGFSGSLKRLRPEDDPRRHPALTDGSVLIASVRAIRPFGVLVNLPMGLVAMLEHCSDALHKRLEVGATLEVVVANTDAPAGKLTVRVANTDGWPPTRPLIGSPLMDGLDLSPFVRSIIASGDAARTAPRADPESFAAWLEQRGYPAHESVLAFEASYGGLQLFETDPDAPALLVGPFACLVNGNYSGHEADLVPVIFAWDDVIHSLDAEGRGFTCAAMVEGVSRPAADDGRQLLTQAILWRKAMTHSGPLSGIDGAHGEERAAALELDLVTEASSEFERWWGTSDRLVVEIMRGNGYAGPRTYTVG